MTRTVRKVVDLSFPANSRYLVLARLSLAGIAPVAQLDEDALADLKLAVTEACSNAVRHAYPDEVDGTVHLSMSLERDTLTVEIADEGRGLDADNISSWDASRMREAGMGFSIMRAVVDELEIDSTSSTGTVVRLVKRLSRDG
jgi:anti-sigma regulatory factor (Ser/Thr protein kinase)